MNRLGTITGVEIDEDKDKIFVDVSLSPTEFEDSIRFRTPGVGVWFVPSVGDIVEVKSIGRNRAVAFSPYTTPSAGLPAGLSEGDMAIRLNENTVLKFQSNGDGYDATLSCDGDLNLDAENIFVGENGSQVATADHTHDYTWSDAGGSGTTDPENEAPTDTEIE